MMNCKAPIFQMRCPPVQRPLTSGRFSDCVCLHVRAFWREVELWSLQRMCLCMCPHVCMCNRFEDVGFISHPPLPPHSSLNTHSSFGLMVECLSNFCPAQDSGLERSNRIHPRRKQGSICQHQSSYYWWFLWQSINGAVDLHSLTQ